MDKRRFGKIVVAAVGGAIVGGLLDRYALPTEKPKESPAFAGASTFSSSKSNTSDKVINVIKELERLHKDGAITDEVYKTLTFHVEEVRKALAAISCLIIQGG